VVKIDSMEVQPLLKMERISKSFPGVRALDEVDLEVCEGEVLALVGENGAGKTTLMEILNPHPAPTGFYKQDSGRVFLRGEEIRPKNPSEAQALGISFIHQHFNLAPNLTVAENVFLGREPRRFKALRIVDREEMQRKTREILDLLGVDISPSALVGSLGVAQRQVVEIAKALSRDASLIIMDEPTSALDRDETERLFSIVRRLKSRKISTIFITHRLEEVFEIADRVVVLRDGKRVGATNISDADMDTVVRMMVGRELTMFPKQQVEMGDAIMEVEDLSQDGVLQNISFQLRKGEILGVAGMVMARALFGIDKRDSGRIYIDGEEVRIDSPRDALRAGLGLVPEDRQLQGLILLMAVKENITLPGLDRISPWGVINRAKEREMADYYVDKLMIQTPSIHQPVIGLSGGNQQKVVLAKWLALKPRVLVLDEPTRGIDVGAKADVHALMSEIAGQGIGIVMISSEMPEILGMSDRIMVMAEGRITGQFTREEADQEKIMSCAM
jgi:ribose transport system ATP-binding protein